MDTAGFQPVDIRRYVRILWTHSWLVVVIVALAASSVYVWSSRRPRVYEASALVRVFDPSAESASGGAGRVDPAREVDIQVLYAGSSAVESEFERRMGASLDRVTDTEVAAVTNADAISIAVRSRSRRTAQFAATTYANAYVTQRRATIAKRYTSQADALRERAAKLQAEIAALDKQIAADDPSDRVVSSGGRPVVLPESEHIRNLTSQRTTLANEHAEVVSEADRILANGRAQEADIDIIRSPGLPRDPVSPLPARDAAVGGLVGLLLGIGISVLRHRLGDRVVTTEDLVGVVGDVPVIASIPLNRTIRTSGSDIADEGGPRRVAEAYRILRAELLFASANRTPLGVLVTSPRATEGKTTVAANVAVSLAGAGSSVCIVDCDLRHGRLHEVFSVRNDVGLGSLRKKSFAGVRSVQRVTTAGATLDVLPCGPAPADPAELLLSNAAANLIAELKQRYQYVILDGPPILPVADALHATRFADAVMLVARAHATQAGALRRALERLRQSPTQLLGAVLVGADPERGYDKYYDYTVAEAAKDRRARKREQKHTPARAEAPRPKPAGAPPASPAPPSPPPAEPPAPPAAPAAVPPPAATPAPAPTQAKPPRPTPGPPRRDAAPTPAPPVSAAGPAPLSPEPVTPAPAPPDELTMGDPEDVSISFAADPEATSPFAPHSRGQDH